VLNLISFSKLIQKILELESMVKDGVSKKILHKEDIKALPRNFHSKNCFPVTLESAASYPKIYSKQSSLHPYQPS